MQGEAGDAAGPPIPGFREGADALPRQGNAEITPVQASAAAAVPVTVLAVFSPSFRLPYAAELTDGRCKCSCLNELLRCFSSPDHVGSSHAHYALSGFACNGQCWPCGPAANAMSQFHASKTITKPLAGAVSSDGALQLSGTHLQVDASITFDQVGGLDSYIAQLKEMIFLPLVYPELFERFHISPPRGVLFHGPPGRAPAFLSISLRRCRTVPMMDECLQGVASNIYATHAPLAACSSGFDVPQIPMQLQRVSLA